MSALSTDWGMGSFTKDSQPFVNWKIGENVSSKLGNQFSMTMGESTSATVGWNNSITLGNKIDLLCDPTSLIKANPAMNFIRALLFGRHEFILGQKNECVSVSKTSLLCNGKVDLLVTKDKPEFGDAASYTALKKWCDATNIVVSVGLLYLGFAGQAISKGYAGEGGAGPAWAASINTAVVSIVGVIALTTLTLINLTMAFGAKGVNFAKAFNAWLDRRWTNLKDIARAVGKFIVAAVKILPKILANLVALGFLGGLFWLGIGHPGADF